MFRIAHSHGCEIVGILNVVILEPVSGYGRYVDQNCAENDIETFLEVSSASDCGRLCDNNTTCVGFMYNEDRVCYLKEACEEVVHTEKTYTYKKPAGINHSRLESIGIPKREL